VAQRSLTAKQTGDHRHPGGADAARDAKLSGGERLLVNLALALASDLVSVQGQHRLAVSRRNWHPDETLEVADALDKPQRQRQMISVISRRSTEGRIRVQLKVHRAWAWATAPWTSGAVNARDEFAPALRSAVPTGTYDVACLQFKTERLRWALPQDTDGRLDENNAPRAMFTLLRKGSSVD
jgi:hypothetical protein